MSDPYQVVALTPIRKTISDRVAEAARSIPHFRLRADVEVDRLLEFRRDWQSGGQVSLTDCLIKGCAIALMEVPALNVQWAGSEIRQFANANISVVVALAGGGLSVPIVRNAESKSLSQISQELVTLKNRANDGRLRMEDLVGGTFTISNLGMGAVDEFDAIINSPQCAILAVGAAKRRVLVSNCGATRIGTVVRVTLSLDHRALDGMAGAAFLRSLQECLEEPSRLQL